MNTKSSIQILGEIMEAKVKFFDTLQYLTEKYSVEGNIFCCGHHGEAEEPSRGYFVPGEVHESLEAAAKNFNPLTQGIYIKENKYTIGELYAQLGSVPAEAANVIDLSNSQVL